jgi:hypothetical protein
MRLPAPTCRTIGGYLLRGVAHEHERPHILTQIFLADMSEYPADLRMTGLAFNLPHDVGECVWVRNPT